MFNTPLEFDEKPYNLCLQCIHIGKQCDGPNFLAMSTERWCEWVKLRKEYLGWTNAKVADRAAVSKVSVDRIMAGNVKDLRTTTMQAVTKALVNGTWGKYPCALAALETHPDSDNAVLSHECEHLRRALEKAHEQEREKVAFLKEQIAFKEKQILEKDELLHERYKFIKRKDVIITIMGIFLAVIVAFVLIVFTVDILNGHFGYFRY